jgi:hypothetical protein
MPSIPTISAPTAPTVSNLSPVTLSTDQSPYYSDEKKTTTSNKTSSTETNLSIQNSTMSSDSAISSLAASAIQQLANATSNSTSINTNNSITTTTPSIPENIQSHGKILRCIVNETNCFGAFKNYWISKPEITGAFLLTGTYTPTPTNSDIFYMYFIPSDNKTYTVSITCDNTDKNLFSLLAARIKTIPLTAQRTGNLVSIRTTDTSLTMDMLLSIDFTLER